jgi:cobalt-zinc-cadmium efflux system outer membrane protein
MFLVLSSPARADDGAASSDAQFENGSGEAGAPTDSANGDDGAAGDGPSTMVTACDGALCDTVGNGPRCSVAARSPGRAPIDLPVLLGIGTALMLAITRRTRRGVALLCFLAMAVLAPRDSRADVVPPPTELPPTLSLDDALRVFRTRGLDLLIAEAAVRSAEGAVKIAGAPPNPSVTASIGYGFTYQPHDPSCISGGTGCSNQVWNVGISDQAAIEDSLSGKRDLRLKVARNALAAAKMSRVDAERTIAFQVKSAYVQVAQATLAYRFAKEVADTNARTLDLFQTRFRSGAINEGDLARIETQKLESDQALDQATYMLRENRVALAFLIGVRGEVPDFDVDTKVLNFARPAALADATEERLLRTAFDHRPDLIALGYQKASSAAQVELTRRQRFPDIALSLTYAEGGYGGVGTNAALQTPMVTLGLTAPLPLFYQLQGELRQAEAQHDTNALQQAKTTSQVVSDVATGYAGYLGARKLVERMETGGLLRSAKTARDITRLQYEKGAASLTDFLDAQRTYIATNVEYFGDLTGYWTAVFQLEEAVGLELR